MDHRNLRTPTSTTAITPTPLPTSEPKVVANYDFNGSFWGRDTLARTEAFVADARARHHRIDEWTIADRAGQPLRIVRTTDPDSDFLGGIDIAVIPLGATDSDPDMDEALRRVRTGRQAVAR
ncbi:hypothetical protein [Streptomyces sp. f150]|uniref:hypothetical protein n=1 Tax=Streptomyces sp. f150 TaxID=1827699 RepID=UPI000BF06112|nr:hypothetical protein [Streptomyces sp. f150]